MPLVVPVYYDFASSLCHVAHRVIARLSDDLSALAIRLEWRPLDLVMLSSWRRGDPIDGLRRENAERVGRELGVALRIPERWMDSRRANTIALRLEGDPREPLWREAVFAAVYEGGRSLDEPGLVEALARGLGLDAALLATPRAKDELELVTRLAMEADVSGVPTFRLGAWPLSGIQDDDTMRAVLRRYAQRQALLQ